jgi:uncharacterized protein YndB with AHSA1/START domain
MQRWLLGPPGWTMPVCEMEVRVGGQFRWRWQNNDTGSEFGFYGEFSEVEPYKKIVHTEFYDPGDLNNDMGDGILVTVTFDEKTYGTAMSTMMTFNSKEECDAALSTGMTDGMEMSYRRLDSLLAALAR